MYSEFNGYLTKYERAWKYLVVYNVHMILEERGGGGIGYLLHWFIHWLNIFEDFY